ncbi:MAG TPA: RagB/SusD family nutrient uptake outer membrane protein, partial [Chitinophagaceae bacterium]|nr:RagB/SusD family nutrient uptake outer membrane protein [Chitinophagaceae bacterium]
MKYEVIKKAYIYLTIALGAPALVFSPGCNKKLQENPQSVLTPAFFSTLQGFQSGLDAAYGGTRNLWGTENLFTTTCIGTDEFITGNDGTGNNINYYSSGYNPGDGKLNALWNSCYTFINTCNGLIDNAPNIVGLDETKKAGMVAEAKFLRANYYFVLVQFWGNITLNKHFQSTPTTAAQRDSRADVYSFIVQDLKDAIAGLPAGPFATGLLPGKANAAAARHVLAKVYLARAGSPVAQPSDYQDAYTTANSL